MDDSFPIRILSWGDCHFVRVGALRGKCSNGDPGSEETMASESSTRHHCLSVDSLRDPCYFKVVT